MGWAQHPVDGRRPPGAQALTGYSREEKDWIEAEWAFHLHGRSAFLSREDFAQLLAWEAEGVPAEAIVAAMETYFERRAKRTRPRSFVALSHLAKDVAKAVQLRASMARALADSADPSAAQDKLHEGWKAVKEPLASNPQARAAFDAWMRLATQAIAPDAPGFLDHHDAERAAFRALTALAEAALGPSAEGLKKDLRQRLQDAKVPENTPVWRIAWEHHLSRAVCAAWGIAIP